MRTSESGTKLCDCGCGGELSEAKIALGWRFLRGHKPILEGKIKTKFEPRRLPASGVLETSSASIIKFAESQLVLLKSEKLHNESIIKQAQACADQLTVKIDAWETVLLAMLGLNKTEGSAQ